MLTRSKIKWEAQEPDIWPCFLCGKNKATIDIKLYRWGTTITSHICNVCSNLPDTILEDRILKPEKELLPVTKVGYQDAMDGTSFLLVNRPDGSTVAFDPALHRIKQGGAKC